MFASVSAIGRRFPVVLWSCFAKYIKSRSKDIGVPTLNRIRQRLEEFGVEWRGVFVEGGLSG